jgi:hypothetical protein
MNAPGRSPELKKHLREIEEGNRRDAEWLADDWTTEELVKLCDIVASHSVSAREAAWRQDPCLTGTHLRHARGALILAIKVFNAATVVSPAREARIESDELDSAPGRSAAGSAR